MRVIGRSLAHSAGLVLGLSALAACGNPADEPLLSISPAEPGTEDTLRLQIAEQPGISYRVAWTRDGEPVADAGLEVSADLTTRGEVWSVTVTPIDDENDKELDPSTLEISIGNAAPYGIVSLTPAAPRTGQTLVAQPGFTDPDEGDEVSYTYSWTRNGTDVQSSSPEIDGELLVKGDVWEVTVVASDGSAEAEPVTASATVANSPPSAEGARILPEVILDGTDVTCVGLRFTDPDNDEEAYKTIWKVDGAVVSNDDVLSSDFFDRGQYVSCELIPTDGEDDGPAVFSNEILVGNDVPTIDSVVIDTSEPNKNAPVTFTANNVSDADGDPVTLDIWWLVNGRGVSKEETLSPTLFERGDEIQVAVIPSDGRDTGARVASAPVTVTNAPPVVLSSELTIPTVYTDSVLMPDTTVVDRDGDPITLAYEWKVNGTAVGDETGMLDGLDTFQRTDDVSYTIVANDGIEDGEAFSSPTYTVVNKPPETPLAYVGAVPTLDESDIHCALEEEVVDADGDTFTLTFKWTLDGSPYTGLTATTDYSGDTIPNPATELKDKWTCVVEASDGTDTSVSEVVETIVRPERIYYYAESKSDLRNMGSSCSSDGQTGYYGYNYYSGGGMTWRVDDDYDTEPESITIRWRQGYWGYSGSYYYIYVNGTSFYGSRLPGSGDTIARSSSCDSGQYYEMTLTGSFLNSWKPGETNEIGIVHSCCSYYDIGVFPDDELQLGRIQVVTADDP